MAHPVFSEVQQIAVAVRNLDEKVENYVNLFGIGPWRILSCSPKDIRDMYIHGERKDYSMRIALCAIGNVQWELLEPEDDLSIYAEFLKDHGEGIHHIGMGTISHEAAMEFFYSRGIQTLMSGNWGGKQEYLYMGTQSDLGFISELFNTAPDFEHPEPEAVFPPESDEKTLKPLFSGVKRIGVVTDDLQGLVKTYENAYGIGPWTLRNAENDDSAVETATTKIGEIELALLSPASSNGRYAEALAKHRTSLHHICVTSLDPAGLLGSLERRGIAFEKEKHADGWYYSFNTLEELGLIIQIAES